MLESDNLTADTIAKLQAIEDYRGDDIFVNNIIKIIDQLSALGYYPKVAEGMRTLEQQAQKVKDGNSQTMESKHLIGKAVDIVDKRWGWSGPAASTKFKFWTDLGKCVHENSSLIWGGDWKRFIDVAHLEEK